MNNCILNTRKAIQLLFCCILLVSSTHGLLAQVRNKTSINSNWKFYKGTLPSYPGREATGIAWEDVSVPHSWNTDDITDDTPGYYRGEGWYKKTLHIPASWKDKEVYLHFEGAAQVAEVFINGKQAGTHTGSYTFFRIPIKKHLRINPAGNAANEVVIKVDNSHSEDIPPLSADFTFFGGLYRDVYLIAANPVHFDLDNYASKGVFITTPAVSAEKASVAIHGAFANKTSTTRQLQVVSRVFDPQGKLVAEKKTVLKAKANEKISFSQQIPNIQKPQLWAPEHPYLYSVSSVLEDAKTGEILDEVSNPLGFRWFRFDAANGFFLNGKPYKLIGASRHQDYKEMANALPDAMHVRDITLLKEMGGNFLRVAHYPQDPAVLEACDRLGLLASVEIPIVNRITETEAFAANCKNMQIEMIRQNFNHPSVIMWTYMNEVLLRPRFAEDKERQEIYFKNVAKLAQEIEDITRREDPSRYTMIPNHGNFDLYKRVGLTNIPMLVGWNLYQGWYSGQFSGFASYLDKHRQELPDKPLLVTEYGADADSRLRSATPVRFDKSMEYASQYHEAYLKAMLDRPFVAAAMIWNLADFSSEERREADPHINNKGVLTIDRKPKDTYYFYQAHLLKEPFIRIGSRNWTLRSGIANGSHQMKQTIEVYSNQKEVTLFRNGKKAGSAPTEFGIARFEVIFENGLNSLRALAISNGQEYSDNAEIRFQLVPQNLKSKELPFTELNVSLGDQRSYTDEKLQQVWLPERPYEAGSWGYVGGDVFSMSGNGRQSYGSDKNILGTKYDPIYETQRVGLSEFKLDVPDGKYEVELHFAELLSDKKHEALAYNLASAGQSTDQVIERSFNISINEMPVAEELSNTGYLEPERAVSFKTVVEVRNEQGINVIFNPVKGDTVLNAIQVKRIF